MKITVTPLPVLARQVYPTEAALRYGFRWWLDAGEAARERFRQTRLNLVRAASPLACEAMEIKSSGSTGKRKLYKWGPNFEPVDRFFHSLVLDGDRVGRTAHLFVQRLTGTGEPNRVIRTEPMESYTVQKHVLVEINGVGPVAGLKDQLAGWNVYTNASVFALLDRWADVTAALDPDGMVVFTGEALPPETEAKLRGKGFDVRDEMRCWDGGATFYTCRHGNRHWVDLLATTWTDGEKLYSSDLFNLAQPFLDYHNGDHVVRRHGGVCRCGQVVCVNEFRNRAAQTVFNTPTGFVATYDLLTNIFLRAAGLPADDLAVFCVGKHPVDVDSRLDLHYLTHGRTEADHGAITDNVGREFFQTLGIRVKVHKYVESSYYKLKKIYWVEPDGQLQNAEAGTPT